MTFEIVDTEIVYQGRVFNVRRETVRTPQGIVVPLDIVDHRGAVTLIPVDRDGQICSYGSTGTRRGNSCWSCRLV